MTEPIDLAGMAEAARLLDDQTQQIMPVPAWLDESTGNELPRVPTSDG
jgi:hypothetical protein